MLVSTTLMYILSYITLSYSTSVALPVHLACPKIETPHLPYLLEPATTDQELLQCPVDLVIATACRPESTSQDVPAEVQRLPEVGPCLAYGGTGRHHLMYINLRRYRWGSFIPRYEEHEYGGSIKNHMQALGNTTEHTVSMHAINK